ncbi:hypothetical protein ACJMK2_013163, partial [Sinanodonta woodiana]
WGKLLRINVGELERDCRADLILHAAATFERTASDPCSCSHGASAEISTSLPATNTPTLTIEHVTDQTLSGLQVCRKTSTIITIAHNITVSHPGASICMMGDHNSSEALVLICCNANSTASWTKGENLHKHAFPLLNTAVIVTLRAPQACISST